MTGIATATKSRHDREMATPTAIKRGRGRPRKPTGEKAEAWIGVAVTVAQKRDFVSRARVAGKTESEYLRECAGITQVPIPSK